LKGFNLKRFAVSAGVLFVPLIGGVAGCQLFARLFPSPLPIDTQVTAEAVVSGAATPVDLAFSPDGRAFYTEKATGRIRVIKNGALLPQPFASVPVNSASERGLLGIDLHPNFAVNGLVYVYYTRSTTGVNTSVAADVLEHRVVRFAANGDIAASAEELIMTLPAAGPGNHNGGIIRFGLDGKLYVSIGDLGVTANSQTTAVLPGKILRINDDGSIPADNPFGAASSIYAIGLRNVFGLGFDADGRLFAHENGPGNHDELNLIVAGGNYGWPNVLGRADDAAGDPAGEIAFAAATANYHDPLTDKTDGSVGSTGVDVARASAYGGAFTGQVFFGQFGLSRIVRGVRDAAGTAITAQNVFATDLDGGVNGLRFGTDGTLWVATDTRIVRLVPTP
jgi:glucose/arabinose dehydrogenase